MAFIGGISRRRFLQWVGAFGAGIGLRYGHAAEPAGIIRKPIPSTGEPLPVIGMGTWLTFDVWHIPGAREVRLEVMRIFVEKGGALIDSSPMYDSSEKVIGYCLARLPDTRGLFSATKVWTVGRWFGIRQMTYSERLWGVERFDLMQVHNLLDWDTHLETLEEWKAEGRVRYVGITTSHGRRHDELLRVMAAHPLDFVQFTYNIVDREAEERLLPMAAERGLAVIINRPFRGGQLFERARGKPLPDWAAEFDCRNWAQFFLKFIISHPGVTCAIPATSNPDHMRENMGAGYGRLPDPDMRRRMLRHIEAL